MAEHSMIHMADQTPQLSPLAAEMVAGLSAFRDALEAGEPIGQRCIVRNVELELRSKSPLIGADHLARSDESPPTSERTR